MKPFTTLTIIVALIISATYGTVNAQSTTTPVELISHVAGLGQDKVKAVATTTDGSIYFLMEYATDITLGEFAVKNAGKTDAALVKVNASGAYEWIQTLSSTGNDYAYGIAVNNDQTAIAITAGYSNSAQFSGTSLISQGYMDILTAVFSTDGQLNWFATGGSTNFDFPSAVTFDQFDNVLTTGWFSAIATFTNIAVTTQQHNDVFVVKYNTIGQPQWVQTLGGNGSDAANAIAVASDNSYFVGGQFEQNIKGGNFEVTSKGGFDGFVAHLSESGTVENLFSFGGVAADVLNAIVIDEVNGLFISGYTAGQMDYNQASLAHHGYDDGFIIKTDANLNLEWSHTIGGAAWDYVRDVKITEKGIVAVGYFSDVMQLGEFNLASTGGQYDYDVFVAQISRDGHIENVTSMGGLSSDFAYKAAVDAEGRIVVAGEFYADFGKDAVQLVAAGGADGMVIRCGEKKQRFMKIESSATVGFDTLRIDLTAENASDLHYMSYEMNYNADQLTYIGATLDARLQSAAMIIEGNLDYGIVGLALGKNATVDFTGHLMSLTFVRNTYQSINDSVYFTNAVFENASFQAIPTEFTSSVAVNFPAALAVWPGDADNSGSVNEQDVLTLAYYWGQTGHERMNASIEWKAQMTYAWENQAATYADTDGKGSVNHNDLRAIVANFGKTTESSVLQKQNTSEVQASNSINLSAMSQGEVTYVELVAIETMSISAVSFSITSSVPMMDYVTVTKANAGKWASEWEKTNRFMSFVHQNENQVGVAMSALGTVESRQIQAGEVVAMVEIQAKEDWEQDATIEISNLSIRNANGEVVSAQSSMEPVATETATTSVELENPQVHAFELVGNYPNPFNPSTAIRFNLSERMNVIVNVYDIQGKQVAELANEVFNSGMNEVPFFAANLSSGTYIYTVQAGEMMQTSRMTLIK